MAIYNKQFTLEGYTFNIKVETEVRTEPVPYSNDSRIYHKVTINDMGHSSFYKSIEVMDNNLESTVHEFERLAARWVDQRNASNDPIVKKLIDLGFTS